MMNVKVQEAIIENIQEFDARERKRFMRRLLDETLDVIDLADMFNIKTAEDYWKLDTIVRDQYMNAYCKMCAGTISSEEII